MNLLLHICCAPCSVACIKQLRGEGIEPTGFWYNPNIHPFTEYRSRRNCLREYAQSIGLTLVDKMINALKPNGIIYTSFKNGSGYEIKDGKYYNYMTKEEFEKMLKKLNINAELIDYFETLPSTNRPGAEDTVWGNYIIRKS